MRLLLIEDDRDLCDAMAFQLRKQGYEADTCHTGDDGLFQLLHMEYDLLILDRMLPVLDGLSILRAIREKGLTIPVILVTALGQVGDRVDGLDAGADDYLSKPFAMEELFARIRALIRRPHVIEPPETRSFADLTLQPPELACGKEFCALSKREAELLEFFMKHPGETLTRERLLAHVWGADADVEMGNLDNYIHFLRRRLKNLNSKARIKTVYGTGYRLEDGSC